MSRRVLGRGVKKIDFFASICSNKFEKGVSNNYTLKFAVLVELQPPKKTLRKEFSYR